MLETTQTQAPQLAEAAAPLAIAFPEGILCLDVAPLAPSTIARPVSAILRDYVEITRPRIVVMVVITTLAGLCATGEPFRPERTLFLAAGIALISAAATVFNQILERHEDARMFRTRRRPVAQGRVRPKEAIWFGSVLCAFGLLLLAIFSLSAAIISLFGLASYDFAYTPLKRLTSMSLYVGAVPGALPPLIGAIFVGKQFSLEAFSLFAFLFVWQIPHFVAIGWLYRDDYQRAGFRILALEDKHGRKSGLTALASATLLFLIACCVAGAGYWNSLQVSVSALSIIAVMFFSHRLLAERTRSAARRLFVASNVSLLVSMTALMLPTMLGFYASFR